MSSSLATSLIAVFYFVHDRTDSVSSKKNGEIASGGRSDGCGLFANPVWQPLCKILAQQTSANVLHATGRGRQNTSSRAHFSPSCRCRARLGTFDLSSHACGSRHCTSARLSNHPLSQRVSSTTLLEVPDPFPSFCSTLPPSTPNSLTAYGWNEETSLCCPARRIAA